MNTSTIREKAPIAPVPHERRGPGNGSRIEVTLPPNRSEALQPTVPVNPKTGIFTPLGFGALLLLLVAIAFPDVATGTQSFFYRDFGLFGYPLASYHRALFWRGELPFWNPFNDCGLPFLAQWNTLALYPGSLIYLLIPLPWSLSLFSLVHLWLGGLGMFFLVRRWTANGSAAAIAGAAYALNGLMLHAVMWPNNIAALGWLPLVLLFAERAWLEGRTRVLSAAGIGALQMLTGAPEVIALTWVITGSLCFADWLRGADVRLRIAARFIAVGLLVAGLSAPQLLPFLDLLQQSHRTSSFGGSSWSMPIWGWANLFVPLFGCSKSVLGVYSQDAQQWTSSYYVGAGAIALMLIGLYRKQPIRVWLVAGLALTGLLLALGDHGPIYPLLKRLAPQVGFTRYPIKFVILPIVAIPLLAGVGADQLHRWQNNRRARFGALPAAVLAWFLVAVIIAGLLWAAVRHPVPGEQIQVTILSGVSRMLFLTITLAAIIARGWTRRHRVIGLLEISAVVLVGLDAITHAPRQNPTLPVAALRPEAVDLGFMPKLGEGRALITPRVQGFFSYAATPNRVDYDLGHRRALLGNLNLVQGIPKVNGFYSLYLRDTAQVESLLASRPETETSGLLDFAGVSQISSETSWFDWTKRPSALPLITGGQRPIFTDRATTLRGITEPSFSPSEVVYLPEEAGAALTTRDRSAARVLESKFEPNCVQATVQAEAEGWVVIAQSYYKCWRVSVDGQPARLWPANLAFQAVAVSPGTHLIRIDYVDPLFRLGMGISFATLIAILVSGILLKTKPGTLTT